MKGIENIVILNFDAEKLRGQVVTRATLHIKGTDRNMMVRKVGVSTIATEWSEGRQTSQAKAAGGDSDFLSPDGTGRLWGGPGSNFLAAVWGRGGTFWSQTYTKPDADQWYDIEVDPRIIEACAARLSFGFALSDNNGQTMSIPKAIDPNSNQSNNYFFSREQSNAAPKLLIETANVAGLGAAAPAAKLAGVEVKPWDAGSDFTTAGLEISFPGPKTAEEAKSILGYRIRTAFNDHPLADLPRWEHPAVPPPGERVRVLLKGQPAGATARAHIEVVGRAGVVIAVADAMGRTGLALTRPEPLHFPRIPSLPADPPGNEHATVFAIPDLTKANPITGNVLEDPGAKYEGEPGGTYSQVNSVWVGKSRTINIWGLRGEWVAAQIVCRNAPKAEKVEYTVTPGDLIGPGGARIPASAIGLSRTWYQHIGKPAAGDGPDRAWYADPLIPLKAGESFTVPDARNAVPHQTNQTIYLEVFIPKDAPNAAYSGPVTITADGVPIKLELFVGVYSSARSRTRPTSFSR